MLSGGHDNFIGRSLAFVGAGGTFIEIGKRGIWTKDEMEKARPDVEYRTLAMDTVCEEDPAKFQELMKRLSARRVCSDAGFGVHMLATYKTSVTGIGRKHPPCHFPRLEASKLRATETERVDSQGT